MTEHTEPKYLEQAPAPAVDPATTLRELLNRRTHQSPRRTIRRPVCLDVDAAAAAREASARRDELREAVHELSRALAENMEQKEVDVSTFADPGRYATRRVPMADREHSQQVLDETEQAYQDSERVYTKAITAAHSSTFMVVLQGLTREQYARAMGQVDKTQTGHGLLVDLVILREAYLGWETRDGKSVDLPGGVEQWAELLQVMTHGEVHALGQDVAELTLETVDLPF